MIKIEISTMTSPGPKAENQDDLAVWNEQFSTRKTLYLDTLELNENELICAALSDGVSSAKEAMLSSKTAIDTIMNIPLTEDKENLAAHFMDHANEEVSAMESEGACTLNCAFLDTHDILFANIGDSPIYLIRDQKITQLAQMQTAATVKRNLGMENITLRDEHMLINFIGNPSFSGSQQMYISRHEILSKDIYILCSDGVSDALGEKQILNIALKDDANAKTLIEQAQKNAEDNISAIMIRIK